MTDFQKRFFSNLKKLYDDMNNSNPDVTLHCIEDGAHLPCHRIILSSSSEYFKNVFSWSTGDIVEVHNNISGETLGIILSYIYSGEISITFDNVSDVLCAGNYFTLMEVVESCIQFILDNLDVSTSIDMLKLSYQLDLSKLFNGVIAFIANNFTYILKDTDLKKDLFTLPMKLMVELLKSNELILRDSETEMLTRPVEREKQVLEFILSFSENLTDKSVGLSSLFTCVKWPLLKIFDEEEFVFSKCLPHLDEEKGKEELEKLLDVSYSDWFITPEKCSPTEEDKSMYCTRSFSCSELIPLPPMADGGQIMDRWTAGGSLGTDSKSFSIKAENNEILTKLDIISRLWDRRTIIGGIGLYFKSGNESVHKHVGITKENGTNVDSIVLDKDEHIIRVHGNAGWLIDCLVFHSSKLKKYGPYGGDGGGARDYMDIIVKYREEGGYYDDAYEWHNSVVPGPHQRVHLDSILVGIAGTEVMTGGALAMTHLKFIFREMLPTSKFLISKDKKCEKTLVDPNRSFTEPVYHRSSSPDSYSDEYDYEDEYHEGYAHSDEYDYEGEAYIEAYDEVYTHSDDYGRDDIK